MSKWITDENIKEEADIKVEEEMLDDYDNYHSLQKSVPVVSTSGTETVPQIQRPVITVKEFRMPSAPVGLVSSSTSSPPGSNCMRPPPPPGPPRQARSTGGNVDIKQERVDRDRNPHEEPSSSIPDLGRKCY